MADRFQSVMKENACLYPPVGPIILNQTSLMRSERHRGGSGPWRRELV